MGAFLVTAQVDAAGAVSGVVVHSERGGRCTVLNPFVTPIRVEDSAGRSVVVHSIHGGRFEFATVTGAAYHLS